MSLVSALKSAAVVSFKALYGQELAASSLAVNRTKAEFEGDYTLVLFGLAKAVKMNPDQLGQELGQDLVTRHPQLFQAFQVVKGFLNLSISTATWDAFLQQALPNENFGLAPASGKTVMVEYSSPNTNKPLHLGHLRNNFLGKSLSNILAAAGHQVVKTCIVNDRGIHICKSMVAWQKFAQGSTPAETGQKGDHFVGDYYVKFNDAYKAEVNELVAKGMDLALAEKQAPILLEAQAMLLKWEQGDAETLALWQRMNEWVYAGFAATYNRIGTSFDKTYYESDTYLLGKNLVAKGLAQGVFEQRPDGSVWIDLTPDGLDEKLVQRKDGTSVYITQDIGLAEQKQTEFGAAQSIYVVGDEQNYHFKVLKLICQKLQLPGADGIDHLSYGMVELPTGKMKSREGTVVDADDLVADMVKIAQEKTETLGKVTDLSPEAQKELFDTIGLGALKFFLLRVDPKKKMIFNPEESIDFHGFTGPFVQYTHARIKSILRKLNPAGMVGGNGANEWLPLEKQLALELEQFPETVLEAGRAQDPSQVAIYAFSLAKTFSTFYAEHSIIKAESPAKQQLRLDLAVLTARVLKRAMGLLGISVPEQM